MPLLETHFFFLVNYCFNMIWKTFLQLLNVRIITFGVSAHIYCFCFIFFIFVQIFPPNSFANKLKDDWKRSFQLHKIRSLELLTLLKQSKMAFHIAMKMAYSQINFPWNVPPSANTTELTHILSSVVMSLLKNIHNVCPHGLIVKPNVSLTS